MTWQSASNIPISYYVHEAQPQGKAGNCLHLVRTSLYCHPQDGTKCRNRTVLVLYLSCVVCSCPPWYCVFSDISQYLNAVVFQTASQGGGWGHKQINTEKAWGGYLWQTTLVGDGESTKESKKQLLHQQPYVIVFMIFTFRLPVD